MTDEELIKIIRSGKNIRPRDEMRTRFHHALREMPQKRASWKTIVVRELIENLKFGAALGLATTLLFVVFGSITHWNTFLPNKNPNLNDKDLLTEASKLDFEIQLGEAQYFTESAQEIAAILDEIDQPVSGKTIDNALDRVTF